MHSICLFFAHLTWFFLTLILSRILSYSFQDTLTWRRKQRFMTWMSIHLGKFNISVTAGALLWDCPTSHATKPGHTAWEAYCFQWAPYIYIYIYMEWDLSVTDRAKSEAKYGGHGGSKLRRFQSPCAIFTIHVNMKDRVGRLRLT